MTIYAILSTAFIGYLLYRVEFWKDQYKGEVSDHQRKTLELQKSEDNATVVRNALSAVLNKTIQITLTDAHLDHIAYAVSERMKEPKQWQN